MVKVNEQLKENTMVKIKIKKIIDNYLEGEVYEKN